MSRKAAQDALKHSEQFNQSTPQDRALEYLLRGSRDVGSHTNLVDALLPTETHQVDAPLPTSEPSGQPHNNDVAAHKGDRHLPGRKHVSFRLAAAKAKQYKRFAEDCDIELGVFYDLAAAHYIECVGSHLLSTVGSQAAHDDFDLKMFKAPDDIIKGFRDLTGNKWKPADDVSSRPYWDADRRLIWIGVLNTLLNAKGKKINSFAYFIPEIEEAIIARLGDETIEIMLPRRRAQWAGRKGK